MNMENIITLVPSKPEPAYGNLGVIEDAEQFIEEIKLGVYKKIKTAVVLVMEDDGRVSRIGLTESSTQEIVSLMALANHILLTSLLK